MKLNKNFLIHNTYSEVIIVPTADASFSGVIRGNKTLGMIADMLRNGTTEEEMIAALKEKFDAEEGVVENDVRSAVERLRKIGAIDD